MSTAPSTTPQTAGRFDPANQPGAQERPKKAVTFKIMSVKDAVATGADQTGDYDVAEIVTQATNGSAVAFPSLMFRPEMFSIPNLKAAESLYSQNSKELAQLEELTAKGKRKGDSFYWVYKINMLPRVVTSKKGERREDGCTPLMAISGGTLDTLEAMLETFDAAIDALPESRRNAMGYKELEAAEIVGLLNGWLQSNGQPELLAVLKQKSINGELSDKYEVGYFVGPYSAESHTRMEKAAIKNQNNSDVSKRLVITYGS